ncbi:DUF4350 domain-containing protein [Trueperella pyogenes]
MKTPTSARTGIALSLIAIVAIAIIFLVKVPQDGSPYSPTSTGATGTRALTTILSDHGVKVAEVGPGEAAQLADETTTLVIDPNYHATPADSRRLIDSRARIVILERSTPYQDFGITGYVDSFPSLPAVANCSDPDAAEAHSISPVSAYFVPDNHADVTGCFPQLGGYGWVQLAHNPRISFIPDPRFLTNEFLAADGNAAFALRKLGTQPTLLWVTGSSADHTRPHQWIGLPEWFFPLLVSLVLTLGWWAVYRGRRFGKLVAEPMPVVVPASEADSGRARLYHRGKDVAHAALALRTGTISRVARGRLAPNASRGVVVDFLARASGRPQDAIDDLFYSTPTTERELTELASQLDQFEREINDR